MAEDYLLEDKSVQIRIKGNSMLPFLRNGDHVELARTKKNEYKIGDVVLARWKDGYVLHRIVFKGKKYFYLTGDNNLFQVESVIPESVIAGVITGHREGHPIEVKGITFRFKGVCWFLLRPFRWILIKFKKSK